MKEQQDNTRKDFAFTFAGDVIYQLPHPLYPYSDNNTCNFTVNCQLLAMLALACRRQCVAYRQVVACHRHSVDSKGINYSCPNHHPPKGRKF